MSKRINHVAVWLLILAQQAVGFIWYSSEMFGERWLALQGKTHADIDPFHPMPFVVAVLAAIALTYFMAWLFVSLRVATVGEALRVAMPAWGCIGLGEVATHYAFLGLKPGLLAIDMGRSLVNVGLITAVLALWPARRVALHQ